MRSILIVITALAGLTMLTGTGCQKKQAQSAARPGPIAGAPSAAGSPANVAAQPKVGGLPTNASTQPKAKDKAAEPAPVRSQYAYKPFTGGKSFSGKCLVCGKESQTLHPVNPVKPDAGGVCSAECAQKLSGNPALLNGK